MTFARQLLLIAALTTVSLVAVVIFSAVNLNTLRGEFSGYQATEDLYKGLLEIKATALSIAKADPILASTATRLQKADARIQASYRAITATMPPESAQRLSAMIEQWNAYAKGFNGAIKIAEESPMDALSIPDAMYKMHLQPMVDALDAETETLQAAETASQARIAELMRNLLWIVLTPVVVAGLVVNLFQLQFGRKLSRRIAEITAIAGQLNEGDFSRRIPDHHRDEIGRMASVINGFVERLESTLRSIHDAAERTRHTAHRISGMTDTVSANARAQSERFYQVRSAIEQMGASINEAATTAGSAASSADGARAMVNQGSDTGRLTIAALSRIDETVSASAKTIGDLESAIQRIGSVSKAIEEIAEQTNLLALNAAIEAARAGEQGRGFAVVADEVRTLASRTAASTADILGIVHAIHESTRQATTAMEKAKAEVREGVAYGEQMGQVLARIDSAVDSVAELMQQIAAVTEEQSAVGSDISQNVDEVVNISAATAQDFDSTRHAMGELVDTSQLLHEALSQFRPAA